MIFFQDQHLHPPKNITRPKRKTVVRKAGYLQIYSACYLQTDSKHTDVFVSGRVMWVQWEYFR